MIEQAPAGLGQHDTAAIAQQQGLAQMGLERTHLPAQCRLRDIENQGCLAEAAQLGHMHEVLELLEVHPRVTTNNNAMRPRAAWR